MLNLENTPGSLDAEHYSCSQEQTQHFAVIIKKNKGNIVKLLPLISFVITVSIPYFMDPPYFEKTWHGRPMNFSLFGFVCLN